MMARKAFLEMMSHVPARSLYGTLYYRMRISRRTWRRDRALLATIITNELSFRLFARAFAGSEIDRAGR